MKALFLVLALLISGTCAATPTWVQGQTYLLQSCSSPITESYTPSNGQSNVILVVHVALNNNDNLSSITGITWNGSSMTKIFNVTPAANGLGGADYWIALGTTNGVAHNIVISQGSGVTQDEITAYEIGGANQSSLGAVNEYQEQTTAAAQSQSVTLTTTSANALVVTTATVINTWAATNWYPTGATNQETNSAVGGSCPGGTQADSVDTSNIPTVGAKTFTYTASSNIENLWFESAVEFDPAGAAPTPVYPNLQPVTNLQ
jgi:hypothetical protein